jgi:hypothetical protein
MSIFEAKRLSNDLCGEANLYVACYLTITHELALGEESNGESLVGELALGEESNGESLVGGKCFSS